MAESAAARCRRILLGTTAAVLLSVVLPFSLGTSGEETQARMTRDVAAGLPVVVHVIVALCDNANQGIVPVPQHLGHGQEPRSNLFWGARYGVRSFMVREGGWASLKGVQPTDKRIRERIVLFSEVQRAGQSIPVYIVAEAWDGAEIKAAIETFLTMAGGEKIETISTHRDSKDVSISAGGAAHLVVFVGHDGLMDFSVARPDRRRDQVLPGSSAVLACASKPYFLDHLHAAGSHPLLLTTGLMAPEAYTLDAVIRSWAGGNSVASTRDAAASAYHKYQKCGLLAARKLFWGESP